MRWVTLPDGFGRALCLAHDDGVQSAGIWMNAGSELDWVSDRPNHRCHYCERLTSGPGLVVRQAFVGTDHEQHWVAEAWAVVGEATTVWAFGLGRNKKSACKPPKPH